jgi:hypothetical protein
MMAVLRRARSQGTTCLSRSHREQLAHQDDTHNLLNFIAFPTASSASPTTSVKTMLPLSLGRSSTFIGKIRYPIHQTLVWGRGWFHRGRAKSLSNQNAWKNAEKVSRDRISMCGMFRYSIAEHAKHSCTKKNVD